MGIVYKAEDTSLDRPVALKFLAAHLVADEDVRKRFEREAKAAAALNHPNICTVHEIAEDNARTFIAMAFLEGEGLDKRIEAGPLKLNRVLDIAIQTAKGLQAAHGKGIVHRDIKPANLMVGPDGHVTIMDFGLAQLADRSKLTKSGTTLGTPIYMSPEQAQGEGSDWRSDIWSLGVVLYEMVIGQAPFRGDYEQAVVYSILNEPPEPMTAKRTGVPIEFELLVNKCLTKNANERYQHTDELLLDLQGLKKKLESGKSTIMPAAPAGAVATGAHAGLKQGQAENPSLPGPLAKYRVIENLAEQGDSVAYRAEDSVLHRSVAIRIVPEPEAQKLESRRKLTQGSLIALTLLSVLAAIFLLQRSPVTDAPHPVDRFSFTVPDLLGGEISPDGRRIAYSAGVGEEAAVWVRDLDRETPRKLEGTEGVQGGFWSPDSQFIGFATGRELKRVAVNGGDLITLCQLPNLTVFSFLGGSWSPRGDRIVFSSGLELFEVPARGGAPQLLVGREAVERGKNQLAFLEPAFLPLDGASQGLAYSFGTSPNDARLGVLDLKTGERREVGLGAAPAYSASGHLVYQTSNFDSGLWALPFSLDALTPTGEAFRIVEGGESPSVAQDGTLIYQGSSGRSGRSILVWRDRTGQRLSTIGQEQASMMHPALSPDGNTVAVKSVDNGDGDIWLHDAGRGTKTRLTFDPAAEDHAAWSSSGKEISFYIEGGEPDDIYSKPADGSGEAVSLPTGEGADRAPDWSRDNRYLSYWAGQDLWYIERKSDGSFSDPIAYLKTAADERIPKFSPDGRYVAYCSQESGRWDVYIRSFPDGGGRRQVSINGGDQPRWRHDGKELFYVEGDTVLMAVSVSTEGNLTVGKPERLFESQDLRVGSPAPNYDVSADGQKFVTIAPAGEETDQPPVIRVVKNWYEEFRGREQN